MKTEGLERALAFAFGNDIDLKMIGCAYGDKKSSKISRNVKMNLKDERHLNVFPDFVNGTFFDARAKDTENEWQLGTRHKGSYLASGIGGSITGEGFNFGLIDDPIKSREEAESPTYQEKIFEWYEQTFLDRQDEIDSVIIYTGTRWNRNDLAGKILQRDGIKEYNGHPPEDGCPEWNGQPNGEWTILSLPAVMDRDSMEYQHPEDPREEGEALWPSRFPIEFLNQFRANKYNWYSKFQQRPRPKGGNEIDRDWFHIVNDFPKGELGVYIRFWDLAGSKKKKKGKGSDNDYAAGALVYKSYANYYILEVRFKRSTPKKIEQWVRATAAQDHEQYGNVRQEWEEEPAFGGQFVSDYFSDMLSQYTRAAYRPQGGKEFYVDLLANKAETGNVYCLEGSWLYHRYDGFNTFFDQVEEWPNGNHDDGLDAAAKAVYRVDMIGKGKAHATKSKVQTEREYEAELF